MTPERVEVSWTEDGQRVEFRSSRNRDGLRVQFSPAAVEEFIGRVRAGDYGPGTPPPPRPVARDA